MNFIHNVTTDSSRSWLIGATAKENKSLEIKLCSLVQPGENVFYKMKADKYEEFAY